MGWEVAGGELKKQIRICTLHHPPSRRRPLTPRPNANDPPQVEELLRAGADPSVTAADYGSAPVTELCSKPEVRELLEAALAAKR